MKKFLVLTALSLLSSSAFALSLDCTDASNGRDAGKIEVGSNRLDYFYTRTSDEAWQLTVRNNALYNNDPFVRQGREFEVGKIAEITGGLQLSLAGQGNLICR